MIGVNIRRVFMVLILGSLTFSCNLSGNNLKPSGCSFGGGSGDTQAPDISVVWPSSDGYYDKIRVGNNFTIIGKVAIPHDNTLKGAYISLDNGANYSMIPGTENAQGPSGSSSYRDIDWSYPVSFSDGSYNIKLYSEDENGNKDIETFNYIVTNSELSDGYGQSTAKHNLGVNDLCNAAFYGSFGRSTTDVFSVYLTVGKTYQIYTTNHSYITTNTADTILYLDSYSYMEGSTYSISLSNDNGGAGNFSHISYDCSVTGLYTIRVVNANITSSNYYYAVGISD